MLTEYLNTLSKLGEPLRMRAVATVRQIIDDPSVNVRVQSRDTFLKALDLYQARPDKGYSLVDCASMVAMRELGIQEVLTRDRHFEQEGFAVLIRD